VQGKKKDGKARKEREAAAAKKAKEMAEQMVTEDFAPALCTALDNIFKVALF
jgi:hypothetical protein